jgi:hypothetical protein
MPQAEHRLLVETTEDKTRDQIVAQLAPLAKEEVKYQYERRLYEHRMGPASSTIALRE